MESAGMTVKRHGAFLSPVWTSGEYHPDTLLCSGPTSVEVVTGKAQEVRQATVLFTMTPPKYKPAFNLEKQATGIFGRLTGMSSVSHNNLEKEEGLGPSYWFRKHPGCTLSGFRNVTAGKTGNGVTLLHRALACCGLL
ncbi:hypothetical protein U0070_015515 [Myodes glareolus]|uniref:Uncharacterized protein n=1 Tax=Myodes glareolus TaxID=447135 RepID=A0AAW0HK88_MYOGA